MKDEGSQGRKGGYTVYGPKIPDLVYFAYGKSFYQYIYLSRNNNLACITWMAYYVLARPDIMIRQEFFFFLFFFCTSSFSLIPILSYSCSFFSLYLFYFFFYLFHRSSIRKSFARPIRANKIESNRNVGRRRNVFISSVNLRQEKRARPSFTISLKPRHRAFATVLS